MSGFNLSLKRICAVKVSACFWSQHTEFIEDKLRGPRRVEEIPYMYSRYEMILRQLEEYKLPITLMPLMEYVVYAMGRKVILWHELTFSAFNAVSTIVWTQFGLIDQEKSIRSALHEDNFFVVSAKNLYSLRNYRCLSYDFNRRLQFGHARHPMEWFWFCYINDDYSLMLNLLQHETEPDSFIFREMLDCSFRRAEYLPIEFFWSRMNDSQRMAFVEETRMSDRICEANDDAACLFFWQLLEDWERERANPDMLNWVGKAMVSSWPWNEHIEQFIEQFEEKAPGLRNYIEHYQNNAADRLVSLREFGVVLDF